MEYATPSKNSIVNDNVCLFPVKRLLKDFLTQKQQVACQLRHMWVATFGEIFLKDSKLTHSAEIKLLNIFITDCLDLKFNQRFSELFSKAFFHL